MTIELSIDAARPLDYGASPNRVVEGSDDDIRTGFASYTDSRIQVLDQIARALHAKRIRDWRLETKDCYGPDRRPHQLGHRAAWCRGHCENALPGRCTPKCSGQTCDETIKIFPSDVDVRCVVLRSDSYAHCSGCLRTLDEGAGAMQFTRKTDH